MTGVFPFQPTIVSPPTPTPGNTRSNTYLLCKGWKTLPKKGLDYVKPWCAAMEPTQSPLKLQLNKSIQIQSLSSKFSSTEYKRDHFKTNSSSVSRGGQTDCTHRLAVNFMSKKHCRNGGGGGISRMFSLHWRLKQKFKVILMCLNSIQTQTPLSKLFGDYFFPMYLLGVI